MPIQFQCPHCQHAMQLPDTAAGKQGKCPKCSNAVSVPAAGAPAPSNPHDEEFWSELDEKKVEDVDDGGSHGAPKQTDAQLLKHMIGKAEAAKVIKRIGVPWERKKEGGMFDRYWDTAVGVMNHATETFGEMKLSGGIGSPLRFLILGAVFGSLIAAVYGAVANTISVVDLSEATTEIVEEAEEGGDIDAAEAATANAVITVAMVIGIVVVFCASFFGGIIGGIIHTLLQALGLQLSLPMVGVKDSSFEKNFRIASFTNGSIFLCNIVPGLGAGFMLFLWFNGMIRGIESVYKVPANKAALAVIIVFVPLVLPIVAVALLFVLKALGYIG